MQSLPKSLFLFVFCLPLAVVLGVLLATPLDQTTMTVVGCGLLLLLTPFLLTGHHTLLILSWNALVNAFFLPGKPYIWMLMTAVSIFFIVLTTTLNRGKMKLVIVPSVAWPLVIFALITFITSQLTGGVGLNSIGSEVFGGKRYIYQWAAIAGFFALSSLPIDPSKRQFLAAGFYLSSITAVVSNVAFMLGENFYFLFLLFPVEWAITQVASETMVGGGFSRIGGLSPASLGVVCFFLVRYGIRGTFDLRKPWRAIIFTATVAAGLFSGFRVTLVLTVLLFAVQFITEGLHRTKYLLVGVMGTVLLAVTVIPFADRLPTSVQRCLTILPIELDAAAVENARTSTDWRLEMWRAVLPDVPQYLWLGKGYALDPKDLYFAQSHISRRVDAGYESSMVAGDYHNGPLTLIIPFGIWGVLAFAAFAIASIRVLWRNFKYGDPEIANINRFNLTAFVVHLIFFLVVFGAFYIDLARFVGIVGLSIAMNRGVASPALAPVPVVETAPEPEPEVPLGGRLQPAFRGGLRA
jgi:hypothetical protein